MFSFFRCGKSKKKELTLEEQLKSANLIFNQAYEEMERRKKGLPKKLPQYLDADLAEHSLLMQQTIHRICIELAKNERTYIPTSFMY